MQSILKTEIWNSVMIQRLIHKHFELQDKKEDLHWEQINVCQSQHFDNSTYCKDEKVIASQGVKKTMLHRLLRKNATSKRKGL